MVVAQLLCLSCCCTVDVFQRLLCHNGCCTVAASQQLLELLVSTCTTAICSSNTTIVHCLNRFCADCGVGIET